ncbi:hypothetical protein V1514DRAFT_336456 [Lipomyces japonicus]|uniref:uncharacterized protein n=1 Tax=Lipomyces japonicus TaxID=56871 RepID=UPI0034CFB91F
MNAAETSTTTTYSAINASNPHQSLPPPNLDMPIPSPPSPSPSSCSSLIFERQVEQQQDLMLPHEATAGHHATENHIPAVLAASCQALTDHAADLHAIQVITVESAARHRQALVSTAATAVAAEASPSPSSSPTPSLSSPSLSVTSSTSRSVSLLSTISTQQNRLSFCSYADVLHDDAGVPASMPSNSTHVNNSNSNDDDDDEHAASGSANHSMTPVTMTKAHTSDADTQLLITVSTLGEAIQMRENQLSHT